MNRTTIHCLFGILLVGGACFGCSKNYSKATKAPVSEIRQEVTEAIVTDRFANVSGRVLVLEYHNFKTGKGGMFRTPEAFRNDLERLYKMGFRPVTASEYINNKMALQKGASPVVITFDDSIPTQYAFKNGKLDPNCAVGIWEAFSRKHPDFPLKATFYVLPNLWGQPKLVAAKVKALQVRGSELGCHTMTHRPLKTLSDAEVKKEFTGSTAMIEKLGQKGPLSLALPLGISPKNKNLLKVFSGVMLVGAGPALSPTDPNFDRMRIPRIQAYDGESGSKFWLDQVEKKQVQVYVAP